MELSSFTIFRDWNWSSKCWMREYGPFEIGIREVLRQCFTPCQCTDQHVPMGVARPKNAQTPEIGSMSSSRYDQWIKTDRMCVSLPFWWFVRIWRTTTKALTDFFVSGLRKSMSCHPFGSVNDMVLLSSKSRTEEPVWICILCFYIKLNAFCMVTWKACTTRPVCSPNTWPNIQLRSDVGIQL